MESSQLLLATSILAEFQASNTISTEELQIFQDMMTQKDAVLMSLLSRHNQETELKTVQLEILKLIKHRHKPQRVAIPPKSMTDEITSPLDNYLLERKKRNRSEDESSLSIGAPILIQIDETYEHLADN